MNDIVFLIAVLVVPLIGFGAVSVALLALFTEQEKDTKNDGTR